MIETFVLLARPHSSMP